MMHSQTLPLNMTLPVRKMTILSLGQVQVPFWVGGRNARVIIGAAWLQLVLLLWIISPPQAIGRTPSLPWAKLTGTVHFCARLDDLVMYSWMEISIKQCFQSIGSGAFNHVGLTLETVVYMGQTNVAIMPVAVVPSSCL